MNNLNALAAETVSRDYFESSVYRNILDMLGTLNNIRQELRAEMLTIASLPGKEMYSTDQYGEQIRGWYYGPGPVALGYAIKKLGKDRGVLSWMWLMKDVPANPWGKLAYQYHYQRDQLGNKTPFPTIGEVNQALMNSRSLSMSLVNRFRNLEWELNRVHLPMVDDLRKSALLLNDYIADLPSSIPSGINSTSYVKGFDRGRIAAYKAAQMLRQMKTWLATMTEKIQERSEFDAAALERIAAEAAARAKAARQAEADAKAEAERKAAEEEAAKQAAAEEEAAKQAAAEEETSSRQSLQDAQEAKKTAAKAAEVEKQIVTSDDVPDKGKGGVLLALAGGAAAFFFLS